MTQYTPYILDEALEPPFVVEVLESYLEHVERLFGGDWLRSRGPHRLQHLWNRTDKLAQLELAALGHAIKQLHLEHRRWLLDCARAVKKQPEGCHGHLFELLSFGAMAAAGNLVKPMAKNHPVYDAEVVTPEGNVLRLSVKNHDLSKHEAEFRKGCTVIENIVQRRVQSDGGTWRVSAGSLSYMDSSHREALAIALRDEPFTSPAYKVLLKGQLAYSLAPLMYGGLLEGSYQVFVRSPSHTNEQSKFAIKLREAVQSLSRAEAVNPREPKQLNVVLMRVHATASIEQLASCARELLHSSNGVVDGVFLCQTVVAQRDGKWFIAYFRHAEVSDRYRASGAHLKLRHAVGSAFSRPAEIELAINGERAIDLTGQYVFQRGRFYYPLQKAEGRVVLPSIGPGIHSYAVFSDGTQQWGIHSRRPDDEELYLL